MISVTEAEVECALLSQPKNKDSCAFFFRDLRDLKSNIIAKPGACEADKEAAAKCKKWVAVQVA